MPNTIFPLISGVTRVANGEAQKWVIPWEVIYDKGYLYNKKQI
jgi:hypothetical protein